MHANFLLKSFAKPAIYIPVFLCLLFVGGWWYFSHNTISQTRLIFLSVGQADATFYESENGQRILIDTGLDGVTAQKLSRLLPWWDRRLDLIILTHEHSDHVGGTLEILKKFKVGKLLVPSESLDSSELQPIVAELKREDIPLELLANDYRVQFDQFSSLYLITDHGSGANEHSLVGILSNGAARALLMADAGIEAEQRLLKNKNILPVELLKVGHHGSDTASSEEFLRATQAKEAVISVGKNNSYHLPSGRVVSRLRRYGLKIARTDEQGDLVYRPIGTDWQLAP